MDSMDYRRGLFFSQIVIRKGEEVDGLFRYFSRGNGAWMGFLKKKKLELIFFQKCQRY